MGYSPTNSASKPKTSIVKSKDSRLRKLVLTSKVKPISDEEYTSLRINAYQSVR
jgi:hypothetical protein